MEKEHMPGLISVIWLDNDHQTRKGYRLFIQVEKYQKDGYVEILTDELMEV